MPSSHPPTISDLPEVRDLHRILNAALKQIENNPYKYDTIFQQLEADLHAYGIQFQSGNPLMERKQGRCLELINQLESVLKGGTRPNAMATSSGTVSVILAADPAQIRDFYLTQILRYFCQEIDTPPVIIRIHQSLSDWDLEFWSRRSGLSMADAFNGEWESDEISRLMKTVEEFCDSPCDMIQARPKHFRDLVSCLRRVADSEYRHPLLLDGLELLPDHPSEKHIPGLKAAARSLETGITIALYPNFNLTEGPVRVMKHITKHYPDLLQYIDNLAYFNPRLDTHSPFSL